jgi:hypothetical protein
MPWFLTVDLACSRGAAPGWINRTCDPPEDLRDQAPSRSAVSSVRLRASCNRKVRLHEAHVYTRTRIELTEPIIVVCQLHQESCSRRSQDPETVCSHSPHRTPTISHVKNQVLDVSLRRVPL